MIRPPEAAGPNAEQIAYWNETAGPGWVRLQEQLDLQLAPFGAAAMDAGAPDTGERVLDVGCGCGTTSLELAERVGAGGAVLGIDLSAPMLERAAARAGALGLRQVRFQAADAQTHPWTGDPYDLVYSRFGVMFFADPQAAFANLRHALGPDGRLAFVCWQPLAENPWFRLPNEAAARLLPLPPADPLAPGPFALGDPERVRAALAGAGFAAVECAPLHVLLTIGGGGSLDAAVDFMLQMGPRAVLLRDADADTRRAVADAVREAMRPYADPAGVRMPSAAWIVRARAR